MAGSTKKIWTVYNDFSTEMKAAIDRSGFVAIANGNMLKRKLEAAVVVARRARSMHAFDALNHFFLIVLVIIVASNYWSIGFGKNKGEVAKDKEAIRIVKTLGQSRIWLPKKLKEQQCALM